MLLDKEETINENGDTDSEPQHEEEFIIPSNNDECDTNANQVLQHMTNTIICKDSSTKYHDEDVTVRKHLSLNLKHLARYLRFFRM